MADASLGEPLGFRNAVVLYSAQSERGTAVTPAVPAGLARVSWVRRGDTHRFRGPGSPRLAARKGGMVQTEVTLRLPAVQTAAKALLQRAARGAAGLPWTTLGLGYQDDVTPTPNRSADQVQDVKLGRLRLGLDASRGHGPLTAELSGIGGAVTELTTLVPAVETSEPWWSYEGIFTREGSAYPIRAFELTVDHGLRADAVIPGSAPSSPREWSFLTEHDETITGTVSRYRRPNVDVGADVVELFDLQLTLTSLADEETLTLGLTDVDFDEQRTDEDERGIFWSTRFEARGWTLE